MTQSKHPPSSSYRYARLALLATLLCLGLVMGFNITIDPYGRFNSPRMADINQVKTRFFLSHYYVKPYVVRSESPSSLILGTSRAAAMFNPQHPVFADSDTYNLSTAGASIYHMQRYLQHASYGNPVDRLFISLDFAAFNLYLKDKTTLDYLSFEKAVIVDPDNRFNWQYPGFYLEQLFINLLSWPVTTISWKTLQDQQQFQEAPHIAFDMHADGFWIHDFPLTLPQFARFSAVERVYFAHGWHPEPKRAFTLGHEGSKGYPMTDYRHLLRQAYASEIDTAMAISPIHARMYVALELLGLLPMYEDWKRQLVRINEEEAQRAGKPAFPLWDFARFNDMTEEAVPAPNDNSIRMTWYTDPAHPNETAGNRMLDEIYGRIDGAHFGEQLNSQNVASNLTQFRNQLAHYKQQHPDMLQALQKIQQDTENLRQPANPADLPTTGGH